MQGKVFELYICESAGNKMISVRSVMATCGYGLHGDRYATGTGAYSGSDRAKTRQVSLISLEDIQDANRGRSNPEKFTIAETRRNIVTTGIKLNTLLGKEFTIGVVRMRGVEPCDPCERPSQLSGKAAFKDAFSGRGGIRAEILTSGTVRTGDEVFGPSCEVESCHQD